MLFFVLCIFLTVRPVSDQKNDLMALTDLLQKRRTKYEQALKFIKQAYQILYELEKEFFVDSSDFFKALDYFQLKRYSKCIPIFVSLIKKDECKIESMFLLAACFFEQKKIKDAAIIYNSIVTTQYTFFDEKVIKILKYSYLKLIDCFILLDQKKDACGAMKSYLAAFPEEKKNPEVHLFCEQNKCLELLESEDVSDKPYLEDCSEDSVFLVSKPTH